MDHLIIHNNQRIVLPSNEKADVNPVLTYIKGTYLLSWQLKFSCSMERKRMSCMQVRLDFASVPITFDCLERRYRLQVDTVFSVHLGNVFVYRSEDALNQPDAMFEHER